MLVSGTVVVLTSLMVFLCIAGLVSWLTFKSKFFKASVTSGYMTPPGRIVVCCAAGGAMGLIIVITIWIGVFSPTPPRSLLLDNNGNVVFDTKDSWLCDLPYSDGVNLYGLSELQYIQKYYCPVVREFSVNIKSSSDVIGDRTLFFRVSVVEQRADPDAQLLFSKEVIQDPANTMGPEYWITQKIKEMVASDKIPWSKFDNDYNIDQQGLFIYTTREFLKPDFEKYGLSFKDPVMFRIESK